MPAVRKILVVGPAWVGDMVMSHTLYQVLYQQYDKPVIDVLAPAWTSPLLERMPEVRSAIHLPFAHGQLQLAARWRFGLTLRTESYDQVIVLPNSLKSAIIPLAAKIPLRTGWRGEQRYVLLNDLRILDKQRYPLMIERFIALALAPNATLPTVLPKPYFQLSDEQVQQTTETFNLSIAQPVLALCPGAEYGEAKRWPSENYATVASYYQKLGWSVWIFGSAKDTWIAREINAKAKHPCIDLTGKTSLGEAIDLLSLSHHVLSNDSGLMHIAAALGKKLSVIYGSSSPKFTPPLCEQVDIISLQLSCSPCFKRVCPLKHMNCLRQLSADKVIAIMQAGQEASAC